MNFLLKIVEGPNKGASIALVAGVAVKVGKTDDCDIILADATLPDAPMTVEAGETDVKLDGEALEPLHVKTFGATSLAVGPADSPWGALVWPKAEEPVEEPEPAEEKPKAAEPPPEEKKPAEEKPAEEKPGKKRRGGFLGCLVVLLLLVIALAAVWWFFGARIVSFVEKKTGAVKEVVVPKATLADVAGKYSLSIEKRDGREVLSGNLKTRAQRLSATAEAYEAKPGVEVDLSDDESFRASAEDAVFTLTEGAVKVVAATNRAVVLSGVSHSADSLARMLRALGSDLPKMRNADVSSVRFSEAIPDVVKPVEVRDQGPLGLSATTAPKPAKASVVARKPPAPALSFPVCGILMTPYPCLVMRNGSRVLEGATVGENLILKIEADAVTVSNSTGVVTWKP